MTNLIIWMTVLCGVQMCYGLVCTREGLKQLKQECTNALHIRNAKLEFPSINTCSGLQHLVRCMHDRWSNAKCTNFTVGWLAEMEALQKDMGQKCDIWNATGANMGVLRQQCKPASAVKVFMTCGTNFYDTVPQATNRTVLVLASLCPQVDKYTACVYRSKQDAACAEGEHVLPHINYVAEKVVKRYRVLCRALQRAETQKTSSCNRKRFINEMFRCGYQFSNAVDALGRNSTADICPRFEKYVKCHKASISHFGCSSSDDLRDSAKVFFKALTHDFTDLCSTQPNRSGVVARVMLQETDLSCDMGRFMRFFFLCTSRFVNGVDSANVSVPVCNIVKNFRHCVASSRHATQCNTQMELNTHVVYFQNFLLRDIEARCAKPADTEPYHHEQKVLSGTLEADDDVDEDTGVGKAKSRRRRKW
ncbi:uncharacterized protein LOC135389985 [Ornithodoros turicata]|uniref:uncharacterized protein LOC135389985 n=1 Tax=Ornithodoros turicata TaxID=34597 RepID=UPI003138BF34